MTHVRGEIEPYPGTEVVDPDLETEGVEDEPDPSDDTVDWPEVDESEDGWDDDDDG